MKYLHVKATAICFKWNRYKYKCFQDRHLSHIRLYIVLFPNANLVIIFEMKGEVA